MKAVFLNGPPRCGKDLAAKFLTRHNIAVVHRKFATHLKNVVHTMFGLNYTCDEAEKKFGVDWKDTPNEDFAGFTPRQMYIWCSEEVMKPKLGSDVFGRVMLRNIADLSAQRLVVFSDCGFAEEVEYLAKYLGKDNCLIVHLHRNGCDFSNDSRSFIEVPGVKTIKVDNRHEKFMFEIQVIKAVYSWADIPLPDFD